VTAVAQTRSGNLTSQTQSILPPIAAPLWSELHRDQQSALHPLQKTWSELTDVQRRKWIAIVKNFNKLSEEDQAKIRERMEAWAALKPLERERARENFATSKLAQPSDKASSWEEYQALPQDEKDKFALQAGKKRPSAAKFAKPPSAVQPKPQPRPPNNYPAQPSRGELRALIAPHTLLPIQSAP
jgi:hypothetical protein